MAHSNVHHLLHLLRQLTIIYTFLARLALSFLLRISRLLRVTSLNSKFSSPQLSIFLSTIFFLLDFSFSPLGNLSRCCEGNIFTTKIFSSSFLPQLIGEEKALLRNDPDLSCLPLPPGRGDNDGFCYSGLTIIYQPR